MLTKLTQNSALRFLTILMLAASCSLFAQEDDKSESVASIQPDRDPMLEFYWNAAAEAFEREDPNAAALTYTMWARTWIHQVSSSGDIAKTDTLVAEYEFKGDKTESYNVEKGNADQVSRIDFSYPDVFSGAYHVNFFPNDTGGPELALGLVADSSAPELPDGLIVIDRQEKTLLRMYLYYPNRDGYKRFSRCFRFKEVNGFIFPDSVWEVGVKLGFLSNENYRIETGVTDVLIDVAAPRESSSE